jgi:hypothetical protein
MNSPGGQAVIYGTKRNHPAGWTSSFTAILRMESRPRWKMRWTFREIKLQRTLVQYAGRTVNGGGLPLSTLARMSASQLLHGATRRPRDSHGIVA